MSLIWLNKKNKKIYIYAYIISDYKCNRQRSRTTLINFTEANVCFVYNNIVSVVQHWYRIFSGFIYLHCFLCR